MNSNQYGGPRTLEKNENLPIKQQGFAKGVCKSILFTSSSLHLHKRKQPS